jgi:two-component system, NtrC family, C4-dicarboxylate transport sensor histidine kinase DctB
VKANGRKRYRQFGWLACSIGLIAISVHVSQWAWRENGLKALEALNEQRLQLVANAIKAEINRQDHLPIVLSLDADVRATLQATGEDRAPRLDRLNRKLAQLRREADTRAMFVIGADGTVIASDDWNAPDSQVGKSLADRPYFVQAAASGRSSYLGIEPSTNRIRYYLAEAIRDGALLGVAVVRIEFDELEAAWEKAGEHVVVADSDGVAFLASDAAYRYRGLDLLGSPARRHPADRYYGLAVSNIEGEVLERRNSDLVVRINSPDADVVYLSQSISLPEYGWTIHRLTSLATVNEDQRDGAIIGGSLSTLIIILALYVMERHRAYVAAAESGAELKRQVAERTRELRESNASLQSEIEERRRTEARLRATQNELVQAGKLAALGQMSAAIAHEINQPLAAIRTFVASTKIFAQRRNHDQVAHNLDLITDLAERMASITGHLKTFARKAEPGHSEPVLVARAVARALFLLESDIRAAGVRIEKDIAPDTWVMGHAIQLEQVMVNLVRNALDAVADVDQPRIDIHVRASSDTVSIAVADNGHGIPADQIDRVFDPFFTTKPVGKGLGLGLSITYGIVQDLGGGIHAVNRPDSGAELTVKLPRHLREPLAAASAIHA